MVASAVLLAVLAGCHPKAPNPTEDVVVLFSVDTLGATAAEATGWCGALGALLGEYGLDLACLDGGVSPGSWTGEAHTRVLWPQHMEGGGRALHAPACGVLPVLASVKAHVGGRYLWGSDNMVLSSSGMESCGGGETQWSQGTDRYDDTHEEPEVLMGIAEADRPVHHTLDAFAREVRGKGAVSLFVNALEPGGHEPRCWTDPETAACDELWTIGASHGLWDLDADRRATWLDGSSHTKLMRLFGDELVDEEMRWRPLFWASTLEAVEAHRATFAEDRLRRILDALREAGRLGDLHLVVFGDHGENPCVLRGLGDETLNCGHNGIPTEYTAFVPVFVSPAAMAAEWVGAGLAAEGGVPWSTVNLSYGLLHSLDVPVPADWPAPEPPGTATAWTCKTPSGPGGASGIHVDGAQAARCLAGTCEVTSFVRPTDEAAVASRSDEVPPELAEWVATPDPYTARCE